MAQLDTTLDDEIAQFFSSSGTSATRRDCDSFALGVFGGPIEPVAIQGATSYTIVAGLDREKIVQFRMKDAQVDMGMLSMARQVHGDIVPGGRVLGSIGDEAASQLVVYEMNKLPGLNYAVVRAFLVEYPTRQMATIHSLARFVKAPFRLLSPSPLKQPLHPGFLPKRGRERCPPTRSLSLPLLPICLGASTMSLLLVSSRPDWSRRSRKSENTYRRSFLKVFHSRSRIATLTSLTFSSTARAAVSQALSTGLTQLSNPSALPYMCWKSSSVA